MREEDCFAVFLDNLRAGVRFYRKKGFSEEEKCVILNTV